MAKAEFKVVGSSPARMGGVDRVVGKGVYGIDLMLKDQLHGAILRSQYAHAKIVSIDTSEALATAATGSPMKRALPRARI